jgi:voltage-gated potassium channel
VLALQFESKNPNANIQTGGEALWWSIVTMTTVGYGDYFPITPGGRITGVFVMVTGIGIIGALASIFASLLVSGPHTAPTPQSATEPGTTEELRALRDEIAALREQLTAGGTSPK